MLTHEGCHCHDDEQRRACLIACPYAGEIVGWGTRTDGSHVPIGSVFAEALWASAEAAKAKREADMPDEQSAIRQLCDAYQRLQDFGWKDPVYAPKDGSPLDILELGSTGIHRGRYEGEWPTGSWWLFDGDVWPTRPAMARAATDTAERLARRMGATFEPRPAQVDGHPKGGDNSLAPAPLTSAVDAEGSDAP